ncbi:receptor-binding cancer antigen expressed on SiSo cells-like [Gigantopelta aegis]|uniref:receptor-binding cancer antigen expressed on SiSo cells-like n=1 Tax=Gigantopelta aegis TaxID=1735272 RepID=UPI001B88B487|nr:receptor-binding cancer antigen expressed on SiSo cells-like [Gigantopelta aegis]
MIKVIWNIIKFIFGTVFKIFSPVKKLICRRRKHSESDISVPLNDHFSTSIDMTVTQSVPGSEVEMQSWDSWGMDEQSRQKQIQNAHSQHYAQRQAKEEEEEEPDIDFFGDMQPEFRKAAKIKLKRKQEDEINKAAITSRLAVNSEVPLVGSELGSWEDSGNAWSDETAEDLSWEAEAAMKDKRRLERLERSQEQQRKKHEREMKTNKKDSHLVAVRLS